MEKLKTYLKGKKHADFALQLGITRGYLSQILSGNRNPSARLIVQIEDATDGAVVLRDWVNSRNKDAA